VASPIQPSTFRRNWRSIQGADVISKLGKSFGKMDRLLLQRDGVVSYSNAFYFAHFSKKYRENFVNRPKIIYAKNIGGPFLPMQVRKTNFL
jgi:hypothetical protein